MSILILLGRRQRSAIWEGGDGGVELFTPPRNFWRALSAGDPRHLDGVKDSRDDDWAVVWGSSCKWNDQAI